MNDDPLDQIAFYIGRAYYAYVGWLEILLARHGLDQILRPGMGPILSSLYQEDDLSIKEIAARTQLSTSTLSGMLTRMDRAAVIERRRDERDGRMVRVRLTPLGRSLKAEVFQVAEKLNRAFQTGLGQREVVKSRRMLKRLIEIMREQSKSGRRSARAGHSL